MDLKRWTALSVLAVLLAGSACVAPGGAPRARSRTIGAAPPDEVLLAAARMLRREFGRVDVDRETRSITTVPVEFQTRRASGTARDLYRGTSTMRRVGYFRVGQQGGRTVAHLRVDVEREDTARARALQPPYAGRYGAEIRTPIEEDAATLERQNTVWTFVRRDHQLESELLAELGQAFVELPPPAPAEGRDEP